MKYARIDIETIGIVNPDKECSLNFGDHLQNIVIKDLYKKIGIPEDEIYVLDFNEISTYDGEYLILPINQAITRGVHRFFSPKIIPVFLGISRDVSAITREEIEYFRQYEPIGCRDEAIFNVLKKHNIDCYLNGCMTVTLSKRSRNPKNGQVYIIEIPKFAMDVIPENLKKDALYLENMTSEIPKEMLKGETLEVYVTKRYLDLKDNARLVITSRLHVAAPCMAMGIPVILIKNNIDYRFAWLDKYLPLYTEKNISEINWNPKTIDFEEIKEQILELSCERIQFAYQRYLKQCKISEFYEMREKENYDCMNFSQSVIDFVKSNWGEGKVKYGNIPFGERMMLLKDCITI